VSGDLSEMALFEVPDVASSARLAGRLAGRWKVAVTAERREVVVVLAELKSEVEDVAVLLREVEEWVEEESLSAVRYELDGRSYVLEAGEPDWSVAAAESVDARIGGRRAGLLSALRTVERVIATLEAAPGERRHVIGLEELRGDLLDALRLNSESP
jgi:predicted RNA-binding protein with EMAP domain